ncbi:uncharacterized protein LOC128988743 isoform X1 [Macrosteles quadrilineatus]|uniref:uncharacterized protein LOC128988743 isoform X1 n=1 Tax=Macrosteles quadrilineatus TaxID=74068 RepID=UPI0023E0CF69|nr:uncharacterized protein LOC128988743 isoform X1 [Macrosteles quadrilineatus]
MKCLALSVVLLWCACIVQAIPQGFFAGLLPTSSPQADNPPKGPLTIFTQGQQTAQQVVGGIISGLAETREKIKNETKKRIQTLLGNKENSEVDFVKPKPDKVQEMPQEETEQTGEKEEAIGEKDYQPTWDKQEANDSLEKIKQTQAVTKPTSIEATTISDAEVDQLLEEIFATLDPAKEDSYPPKKDE